MAREIEVRIRGTSAMLQHRRTPEEEGEIKRKSGQKDYSKEWEKSFYHEDGLGCYIPAEHIQASMEKSATDYKIKGRMGKTYKNLVKAACIVATEKIALGKQEPDFRHEAFVTISRSSVLRVRPGFKEGWEAEFTLLILDDQLSNGMIREILENAGKFYGIGDWRPRFGRFEVLSFEVTN